MKPRRPAATDTTSPEGRARDDAIVDLAVSGVPIMEIGRRYGAATVGRSTRLVRRALESRLPELDRELQQRLDQARLDQLWSVWWKRAEDGDPLAALIIVGIVEARSALQMNETGTDERSAEAGGAAQDQPDEDPGAGSHPELTLQDALLALAWSAETRAEVVGVLLASSRHGDALTVEAAGGQAVSSPETGA